MKEKLSSEAKWLLNSISENTHFKKSSLHKTFKEMPLGFVDIGASGGIHPLIMPVASLTHCACFEPDKSACKALKNEYSQKNPFSKITIFDLALSDKVMDKKLYVTKSAVNTSLLEPMEELVSRYNASGFQLQDAARVKTETLDRVIYDKGNRIKRLGEFIKIDCQGTEYDVLKGAEKVLDEHCMALYAEMEFLKMYKGQKIFSEIDLYLRKKGFLLYAIYHPRYISAKKLNRRKYESDERIICVDALYFKDPMDSANKTKKFSKRHIEVLLLAAILTKFYDFALEILGSYYKDHSDRKHIEDLILSMSKVHSRVIEDDLDNLVKKANRMPEKSYLLAKKFIDEHKYNNNIDFITTI